LKLCTKCGRYFLKVEDTILTKETSASTGAGIASQGAIGGARILRILGRGTKGWNSETVSMLIKHGLPSKHGVKFLGKAASTGGTVVQIGVGVYRLFKAKSDKERAQAVLGTGASIGGGIGGASIGSAIGTLILPGIGSVVGGIVGGIVCSIGAQISTEAIVGKINKLLNKDLCLVCQEPQEE